MARLSRAKRVGIFALIVLLLTSYILYALMQPLEALQPSTTFHFQHDAQPVQLTWPGYGESAVGAVGYGVLASHGPLAAMPTASVIKILTALAVLHVQPLRPESSGPLITLTSDDVASYQKFAAEDGSVVRVQLGETLTERQALEALLLPSANNMAETLARWTFGSLNAYLAFANNYALTLGLHNTVVTDPSGFDPATVSTPNDLVLLGEAGLANPTLAAIVAEPDATIPVAGLIRNTDILLGHDGVIGIKTGNNDQNPGCFLAAATYTVGQQSVTVVSAVMQAPGLFSAMHDSLPLLASASHGFSEITVAKANQTVGTYKTPWGPGSAIRPSADVRAVVWNDSAASATLALSRINAPARAAQVVGRLIVTNSSLKEAISAPVVLASPLPEPNIFWRLTHPQ